MEGTALWNATGLESQGVCKHGGSTPLPSAILIRYIQWKVNPAGAGHCLLSSWNASRLWFNPTTFRHLFLRALPLGSPLLNYP